MKPIIIYIIGWLLAVIAFVAIVARATRRTRTTCQACLGSGKQPMTFGSHLQSDIEQPYIPRCDCPTCNGKAVV